MTTLEIAQSGALTARDLPPLRRLLGAQSMVIRVNADGTLMPFEVMPELFVGRSIRNLLHGAIRSRFEEACSSVADLQNARVFRPFEDDNAEVMITPVLNEERTACQFLVVWARRSTQDGAPAAVGQDFTWADLTLETVETRYRARRFNVVEATPWWAGDRDLELWDYPHQLESVGMSSPIMTKVALDAVEAIADSPAASVRISAPATTMFDGLVSTLQGATRATRVATSQIELAVPVHLAVDADLLSVIVHLRALGVRIDISGLAELTSNLHKISDTSDYRPSTTPEHAPPVLGNWTKDPAQAIRESASL